MGRTKRARAGNSIHPAQRESRMMGGVYVVALAFVLVAAGCKGPRQTKAVPEGPRQAVSGGFSSLELKAFTAIDPIDTHAHVFVNDPAFNAMIRRLNLHLLDIVVVDDREPNLRNLAVESSEGWTFVHAIDGRAALCTSFDPFKTLDRGFDQSSIQWINREFARGAIAVKLWKNVGMEIKDAKGNYLLPDNPIFEPIYRDIAAHNKTLVAHVADPDSAWAPPNPASPDYSYYKENPAWYMYGQPHPASKQQILQARDHILAMNPHLRVVGAHLGSMESNFHEVAQHLDRYPNFAVDLAARMPYLMMQPRADMIAFILKYQDRLIYGTDNNIFPPDNLQAKIKDWEEAYARDWRFLATDDLLEYNGRQVRGLALPDAVLRKIYHDNAVQWFPGILPASH